MAWEENLCICLHMQLIAILSRIGANRATCALHKYAADALTIHNENISPLGGLKKHRLGCLFYGGRIYAITYLLCIFAL